MPLYGKFILIFIALCHFFEREYPHSLKIVGLLFQPRQSMLRRVIALTFQIPSERAAMDGSGFVPEFFTTYAPVFPVPLFR